MHKSFKNTLSVLPIFLFFLSGEFDVVYYPHLFDKGRFSRLPSAQQKKSDLLATPTPVLAQLKVNSLASFPVFVILGPIDDAATAAATALGHNGF